MALRIQSQKMVTTGASRRVKAIPDPLEHFLGQVKIRHQSLRIEYFEKKTDIIYMSL